MKNFTKQDLERMQELQNVLVRNNKVGSRCLEKMFDICIRSYTSK